MRKMKYLFSHWDKIKDGFAKRNIFLLLDYDGTLAPIAKTPDKAIISKEAKELLRKLARDSRYRLAIVSGRAIANIIKVVGINGIFYVGNHGLQMRGPGLRFEAPLSPRFKVILRHLKEELSDKLSGINGVLIEDKGLSLSVHYRLVNRGKLPSLRKILRAATEPYILRGKIKLKGGKKVFEIRPAIEWDKGKAALWLLAAIGVKDALPLYIGDDITDEDAFRALENKGITISVGKAKNSAARYFLKDAAEVIRFLKIIWRN